jgi:hypothetical protein
MRLPPNGWRPQKRHTQMRSLGKYIHWVTIRQGETYSLESTHGYEAYQDIDNSGTVSLQVPELNFFTVLKQTLGGRREIYSEVVLGHQDATLFEPPSGGRALTRLSQAALSLASRASRHSIRDA